MDVLFFDVADQYKTTQIAEWTSHNLKLIPEHYSMPVSHQRFCHNIPRHSHENRREISKYLTELFKLSKKQKAVVRPHKANHGETEANTDGVQTKRGRMVRKGGDRHKN